MKSVASALPPKQSSIVRPCVRTHLGEAVQLSIYHNLWLSILLLTPKRTETTSMILWAIFVILLLLWLVGVVISYTMGGFIHIFLVAAVVALIFQITSDRRTAP